MNSHDAASKCLFEQLQTTRRRMNIVLKFWLVVLSAVSLTVARAEEQPRTLNLQEIDPQQTTVIGKELRIVVIGQPPQIMAFTNTNLTISKLSHRVEPGSKLARVTYGVDLLGFAYVKISRFAPKAYRTFASLFFETEEQAVTAGKALKVHPAAPSPLRKENDGQ